MIGSANHIVEQVSMRLRRCVTLPNVYALNNRDVDVETPLFTQTWLWRVLPFSLLIKGIFFKTHI